MLIYFHLFAYIILLWLLPFLFGIMDIKIFYHNKLLFSYLFFLSFHLSSLRTDGPNRYGLSFLSSFFLNLVKQITFSIFFYMPNHSNHSTILFIYALWIYYFFFFIFSFCALDDNIQFLFLNIMVLCSIFFVVSLKFVFLKLIDPLVIVFISSRI